MPDAGQERQQLRIKNSRLEHGSDEEFLRNKFRNVSNVSKTRICVGRDNLMDGADFADSLIPHRDLPKNHEESAEDD